MVIRVPAVAVALALVPITVTAIAVALALVPITVTAIAVALALVPITITAVAVALALVPITVTGIAVALALVPAAIGGIAVTWGRIRSRTTWENRWLWGNRGNWWKQLGQEITYQADGGGPFKWRAIFEVACQDKLYGGASLRSPAIYGCFNAQFRVPEVEFELG